MKTKICVHKNHIGERNLPISEFRNNARSKDGKAAQCKSCADTISKASNAKRPGRKYTMAKKRRQEMREDYKHWKSTVGCKCCVEIESVCLELHHLDPTKKELNVSDMVGRGWAWQAIMNEADKCVVLCANCHRKVHAGLINIDDYK